MLEQVGEENCPVTFPVNFLRDPPLACRGMKPKLASGGLTLTMKASQTLAEILGIGHALLHIDILGEEEVYWGCWVCVLAPCVGLGDKVWCPLVNLRHDTEFTLDECLAIISASSLEKEAALFTIGEEDLHSGSTSPR